jgi:competence protein ComEC
VCFAAGALFYLSLPFEPSPSSAVPVVPAAWVAHRAWRRGWASWAAFVGLAIFMFGFAWTLVYTHSKPMIMLEKEHNFTQVSGRIAAISDVPGGYRVTIDTETIEDLTPKETPQRVRLKLRGKSGEGLMTGQHISLRAGLLPPTGPVMPQAFDFARYFYFQGIGAVGYGIPPVDIISESNAPSGFWPQLTAMREALSARIRSQMSVPEGAVAAALMMGDRAAIPEDVNQVMRDTNLSHVLAISGMHMALVTGIIFFALRWLLAALPQTRYVRSPKKLAAWLALAAGAAYLLIAGLPISACRAFIMVALVFAAILLDRQVMPMRSLAVAALLLLLVNPSYAMQPGFQLSFMATAALIGWYERVRSAADDWFAPQEKRKRMLLYLGGVMMTSLVAEVATAPLVLYHFNNVSFYGLLANLIVMPIVSFWIMPFIVLSFVLLPLGLEVLALDPVEWGISAMIAVSRWVADIPGAQFFAPSFPGWSMALIALGMLWIILWRSKIRFWGGLPIAIGLLGWLSISSPDLMLSADGKQIAGRIDGELRMLKGRANSFTPKQWANGTGATIFDKAPKDHSDWRCDDLGCVYQLGDQTIAFPNSFEGQAKDCRRADLVVTPFYLYDRECAARVIDRRARQDNGHIWMWFSGDGLRQQSTRDIQGVRPWSGFKN